MTITLTPMRRPQKIQVIHLGTGASEMVPCIDCLTSSNGCLACKRASKGRHSKDRRAQTSMLLKVYDSDSTFKTILIDAGLSFYQALTDLLPRLFPEVRNLDAVILTHAHDDAMGGLSSLRAWTMGEAVQRSVDVFCDDQTYASIKKNLPHIISPSRATGSALVAGLQFHTFTGTFALFDGLISFTPIPVHHGLPKADGSVFTSNAFLIDSRILHMSDVSFVPPDALKTIKDLSSDGLDLAILDSCIFAPGPAHLGFAQTVSMARKLGARRTVFTQIAHGITHEAYEAICQAVSSNQRPRLPPSPSDPNRRKLNEMESGEAHKIWRLPIPPHKRIDGRNEIKMMELLDRRESVMRALGLKDDDLEGIVEAALWEVERWEGTNVEPFYGTIAPAYDGMVNDPDHDVQSTSETASKLWATKRAASKTMDRISKMSLDAESHLEGRLDDVRDHARNQGVRT